MTKDFARQLTRLHARRESAFDTWLKANARLSCACEHLGHLRLAKAEALSIRGISVRQVAEFRRWDEGKTKPVDSRTIAWYAKCRLVLHAIDEKWDARIAAAQVEVEQSSAALAVATSDLLSIMPVALASELTGLPTRRLCVIARSVQNTDCAPTRMRSGARDDFPT